VLNKHKRVRINPATANSPSNYFSAVREIRQLLFQLTQKKLISLIYIRKYRVCLSGNLLTKGASQNVKGQAANESHIEEPVM